MRVEMNILHNIAFTKLISIKNEPNSEPLKIKCKKQPRTPLIKSIVKISTGIFFRERRLIIKPNNCMYKNTNKDINDRTIASGFIHSEKGISDAM